MLEDRKLIYDNLLIYKTRKYEVLSHELSYFIMKKTVCLWPSWENLNLFLTTHD